MADAVGSGGAAEFVFEVEEEAAASPVMACPEVGEGDEPAAAAGRFG
jgi:hypothetical protein